MDEGWENVPRWECEYIEKVTYFFQFTQFKMSDNSVNLKPMWNKLMSKVDLEEPTPIIDQVYFGHTQRESETNKRIATEKSDSLNKLVPFSTSTITNFNKDTRHNVVSWSCDMQGHGTKSVLNAVAKYRTKQRETCTECPALPG